MNFDEIKRINSIAIGNELLIYVLVNDYPARALIDTGSVISVMPLKMAKILDIEIDCKTIPVKVANGDRMNIIGSSKLDISVYKNEKEFRSNIVVYITEKLSYDILLGNNFLEESGMVLNFKSKEISFENIIPDENKIVAAETCFVKPFCSVNVLSKISSKIKNSNILVESNIESCSNNKILVPRAIYEQNFGKTSILVSNISNKDICVTPGMVLGIFQKINSIEHDENLEVNQSCEKTLPDNNEEIFKDISCGSIDMEEKQNLINLLNKYKTVFALKDDQIGCTDKIKVKIELEEDTPIWSNPYNYCESDRKEIKNQIDRLLSLDIIEPSLSSYASPVVLVKSPGRSPRLCVDFRKINMITKRISYPLPRMDHSLMALKEAKIFSSLDMCNAYHQLPLEDNSKEITSFITNDGLYQYKRLPFGWKSAGPIFQSFMDVVLANLKWNICLLYLDDICVFSTNFKEHMERLESIFICLSNAKLTLKPSKCKFLMREIKFLGHIINESGIVPDSGKIETVQNLPTPTNMTELKSCLGLFSFYRRFVENFSKIAFPLIELTKNNVCFKWNDKAEEAFNTLKHKLCNPPILIHFDPSKVIEIRTDACDKGLGAILVQYKKNPKEAKVVEYASRSLSKSEKNYSITEKELLAIVFGVNKFKAYITGLHFIIITDHHALCFIMKKPEISARLARWVLTLQEYDFEINFKSGKKHKDADCLSRFPLKEITKLPDIFDLTINSIEYQCEFLEMQKSDQFINKIRQYIENHFPINNYFTFTIIDEILYKQIYSTSGAKLVPVLPQCYVKEIIRNYHEDILGSHLGEIKTFIKIKDRTWWPNMRKSIKTHVKNCYDCLTKKNPKTKAVGLLQPIQVGGPFETVGIDIFGPITKSSRNNCYIITATDYLTKWVEGKAIKKATAFEVAKFIVYNVICRHGAPFKLISDRGTQFLSEVVENILLIFGIVHRKTSGYHPQTNGQTEKFNETLANMLSMYCNSKQQDWDLFVELVIFAYNTSIHSTTRYSPFYLVYGRDVKFPMDSLFDKTNTLGIENPEEYGKILAKEVDFIRTLANNNIQDAQIDYKERFDLNRKDVYFEKGNEVLIYRPIRKKGLSSKFIHKWCGPYKIVDKLGPTTYKVENLIGRKRIELAHVSRIKNLNKENLNEEATNENDDILSVSTEIYDIPMFYETNQYEYDLEDNRQNQQNFEFSDDSTDVEDFNNESDETIEYSIEEQIQENDPHTEELQTTQDSNIQIDNVPNTNENAVRRSSRKDKGFNSRFKNFFFLLLNIISIYTVDTQFHEVPPILWRNSKIPVIIGTQNVEWIVKYISPCDILDQFKTINHFHKDELKEWCMSKFEEDFTDMINKFCIKRKYKDQLPSRRKRFVIIGAILLGVVMIASVAAIGVATASLIKSHSNEGEINLLKSEQDKILKNLEQQIQENLKVKNILEKLNSNFIKFEENFNKLKSEFNNLVQFFPDAIKVLSSLITNLSIQKENLLDIARKWKKKQISEKLFDLFNMTIDCNGTCLIEKAVPQECIHNPVDKLITFKFNMEVSSVENFIMLADSFNLLRKPYDQSKLCILKYKGPKYILYNKLEDCVTLLPFDEMLKETDMFLSPNKQICNSNFSEISTNHLWQSTVCDNDNFKKNPHTIQVKMAEGYLYLYCYPHLIHIYGKFVKCPNIVFALSLLTTFTVLVGDIKTPLYSFSYNGGKIKYHSNHSFNLEWSNKINFHIINEDYKEINFTDVEEDIKKLGQITLDLKSKREPLYKMWNIGIAEIIFILIIIMFLLKTLIIIWRKKFIKEDNNTTTIALAPLENNNNSNYNDNRNLLQRLINEANKN
ncbi:MAG: RNase H-like domain-containing protein [Limnohabitans sp.]|nr:RNase H-like domain-containing protein [Limnohabitans sp.]